MTEPYQLSKIKHRIELPFDYGSGKLKLEESDYPERDLIVKNENWSSGQPSNTRVDILLQLVDYSSYSQTLTYELSKNDPVNLGWRIKSVETVRKFGFVGIIDQINFDVKVPAQPSTYPNRERIRSPQEDYLKGVELANQQRLDAVDLIQGHHIPWLNDVSSAGFRNVVIVNYLETQNGVPEESPGATLVINNSIEETHHMLEEIRDLRLSVDERFKFLSSFMIKPELGVD